MTPHNLKNDISLDCAGIDQSKAMSKNTEIHNVRYSFCQIGVWVFFTEFIATRSLLPSKLAVEHP